MHSSNITELYLEHSADEYNSWYWDTPEDLVRQLDPSFIKRVMRVLAKNGYSLNNIVNMKCEHPKIHSHPFVVCPSCDDENPKMKHSVELRYRYHGNDVESMTIRIKNRKTPKAVRNSDIENTFDLLRYSNKKEKYKLKRIGNAVIIKISDGDGSAGMVLDPDEQNQLIKKLQRGAQLQRGSK